MTEPKINLTIVDQFDPETTAMLQAFYSRNHMPISERIAELGDDPTVVKESLKKWYVGYGHKSIGQCGATTLFLEGCSILAAKAFQDTQLYNGQETSTRYIDFSNQPIHDPLKIPEIQADWIEFYSKAHLPVLHHVADKNKLNLDNEVEYKTAKAATFDILRSFLPAGCATQLSWFTSFTHAKDRLVQLAYHPLSEVRELARSIAAFMQKKYPFAMGDIEDLIKKTEAYYSSNSMALNYLTVRTDEIAWPEFQCRDNFSTSVRSTKGLERERGVPVPRHLSYNGRFTLKYILDYGSFRDIQRHRNCNQMMPLLTTDFGFAQWYIDALPMSLREKAKNLIFSQTTKLARYRASNPDAELQNYIPLGFNVPCMLECDFPQLVYIAEIRSSQTVHPNLRRLALKIAKVAKQNHIVNMFDDDSETTITTKRGKQDIVKK